MSRKNCHAQSYATPAQRWNQYQYKSYSNASFQCFRHCSSPFAVLIDFISITRIWEQLLFNIRGLIYYLWWSIANWNSHFSFSHHMSEANASYLEWNGKCFITKLLRLKRLVWIGWSTPVGVWSILRHCRKIWSTANAVWSKAFSGFMFFCLEIKVKKHQQKASNNFDYYGKYVHSGYIP